MVAFGSAVVNMVRFTFGKARPMSPFMRPRNDHEDWKQNVNLDPDDMDSVDLCETTP